MSDATIWAVSERDVLAELTFGVRVVRAPGAIGARPRIVVRDVAPALVHTSGLRAETAQRILHATDITHPGYGRILGALRIGRQVGLAMELVAGCAVDDLASASLSVQTVEHVASKVAGVLESLHHGRDALGRPRRLVHGSVTPDKVMLSFAGDVKLLDFAVAGTSPRTLVPPRRWSEELLPWVSPELLDGSAPTAASDLYMLGATTYLLLTGQPPYPPGRTFDAGAFARLAPPSELREEVRPSLDALVMSMLDPDPSRRPVSAQEVRDRLDARPARTALSSVVRDAVPERLRWLEDLEDEAEPSPPPFVVAEPVEAEPPSAGPAVWPTTPPSTRPERVVALPPFPARPPSHAPSMPYLEATPEPARPAVDHLGFDSVELLRRSVKRLFDDSLGALTGERLALPAPAASAPTPPPEVLTLPGQEVPRPSWRRPIGLLMILGAGLVLTALTAVHPEDGVLDVRVGPPEAVVEVVDHPEAGAIAALPPGVYRVRARAPGYAASELAVQVDPGEHRIVLVTLEPEVD